MWSQESRLFYKSDYFHVLCPFHLYVQSSTQLWLNAHERSTTSRICLGTGSSNPSSLKWGTSILLSFLHLPGEGASDLHFLFRHFLQIFELSVPQVISSHMCHFSFTMLNRALIKRFAVASWIFFSKKKKITQLQEAAVTLQKDMQATERLTGITISKSLE